MNMFFKFKDALVTPPLLGSILGGITRDSIIKLAKHKESPWTSAALRCRTSLTRRITARWKRRSARHGGRRFSSGSSCLEGPRDFTISGGQIGKLTQDFYDTLTGIQYGEREDPFGWVVKIS